jgi:competence protein ComEC
VLLILDPWLARSYGFALSCAASAGLMTLSSPLARKIAPWLGEKAAPFVAVPTVAAASCAPTILLFTTGLPATTVLANLAVTPAVAPTTLLSLGATLAAPILPPLATVLAKTAAVGTGYLAWVATKCAGLKWAIIPWPGGARGVLLLVMLEVGAGVALWRWQPVGWPNHWRQRVSDTKKELPKAAKAVRRRLQLSAPNRCDILVLGGSAVVLGSLLFGVALAGTKTVLRRGDSAIAQDWLVAFCDVTQGDGMVIRSGPSAALVVDVGPDPALIGKCLSDLNITEIELLVLSHFHADHVGGLQGALAGHPPKTVLVPNQCDQGTGALAALEYAGATILTPKSGQSGTVGRVKWQRLGDDSSTCNIAAAGSFEDSRANDESLVLAFSIHDFDIVALGDLELAGQERLATWLHQNTALTRPGIGAQGIAAQGGGTRGIGTRSIEIVKVAHHGSAKQAPQLARLLSPKVAVFSVGAANTFGHPTQRALDIYEQVGATNVRTDQCGTAVFAATNGKLTLNCLK